MFTEKKTFKLQTKTQGKSFCELFLKKTPEGEHHVYVIGKNGEKRPEVKLAMNILHKWFCQDYSEKGQKVVLITD